MPAHTPDYRARVEPRRPSEWEPEPLHLPVEVPRERRDAPESRSDDEPIEAPSRVIVIDLA